jgi:hypothetical protein
MEARNYADTKDYISEIETISKPKSHKHYALGIMAIIAAIITPIIMDGDATGSLLFIGMAYLTLNDKEN